MSSPPVNPELQAALQEHFGFDRFKEGQSEAIRAAQAGRDVVVIMPTGSGKSLCYQLWAMVEPGVTLVVSPLISLMKDQVDSLDARGLPATFINSSLSLDEMRRRMDGVRAGAYRLVYVAPERFRNQRFMSALSAVTVSLLAVDEAHCISQWGHDFRPDYLRLRKVVDRFPEARVMALTATATPDVRADVILQLGLDAPPRANPAVLVYGFARPNLHLAVTRCATHTAKLQRIARTLEKYPTGIIYCSTRKQTERVYQMLKTARHSCVFYHAGLTDEERKDVQDRFMSGQVPVVVATNAFGMGVDRSDLRAVIHWDIPGSLEAYYQEIGRAGRDGLPARCELLYNYADVRTQEFFIEGANPTPEDVLAVLQAVKRSCAHGPVTATMAEWAEAVGQPRKEMMVRTAMSVLERAGMIVRDVESGARSYTTDLAPNPDPDALRQQLEYLVRKRERDEQKLKAMLDYAGTQRCRHAHIIGYFGEDDAADTCAACDRCMAESPSGAREPTEDEWVVVQKVLSCAARMQGQYGIGRLIQVLLGSKAKQILDWRLHELPTYGILGGHREAAIRRVVEELIRERCLRIAGGEYPLIELTAHGKQVMWRKATVHIDFPNIARPAPPSTRRAAPDLGTAPADLVASLKAWRLKMSQIRHVPTYTICNNKTLIAIAAAQPDSHAALEAVYGMGPARVKSFGDAILEIVDRHRSPG